MAPRSRIFSEPLKPALLAALRAQLAEGEHLAWASSPEPVEEVEERKLGKLEGGVILGGGYALLGSCFMAVRSGNWWWLSIPIVIVALGVAAYFINRALKLRAQRRAEGIVYGFTTRRALSMQTYPDLTVQALKIEEITDITLRDERDGLADLVLHAPTPFVFQRIAEPARARAQLLRAVRDPQTTEQEIAAAEAYARQMRQLMVRSVPR